MQGKNLPIVSRGEHALYAPENQLGEQSYWNEHFQNTARKNVETYLGKQNHQQQEEIMFLAKQFHSDEKPLAPTVSLIPVAAHQESGRVIHALGEFAKQQTHEPFSVLLYLNAPAESSTRNVKKTMRAVEEAKSLYPHLDVRSSEVKEFAKPVIGRIRKNLWDAALYLAHYEGLFDERGDVIGFNHDIDIESMGRGLIRNVQNYYSEKKTGAHQLRPAATQIRHAHDPSRPNVSRVVRWRDKTYRVRLQTNGCYEAGIIVPFGSYARSGGINPNDSTYETTKLTRFGAPRISHTTLLTSPRRFGERLHHVESLSDVWSDETFGANDKCRVNSNGLDISEEHAFNLISESLDDLIPAYFYKPINDHRTSRDYDNLRATLEKRKRLALTVLRHVEPSGILADYVDETYSVDVIFENIKKDI